MRLYLDLLRLDLCGFEAGACAASIRGFVPSNRPVLPTTFFVQRVKTTNNVDLYRRIELVFLCSVILDHHPCLNVFPTILSQLIF